MQIIFLYLFTWYYLHLLSKIFSLLSKTVREFTYHGDRVNVDGGCEAAVTARTGCGWVSFRECSELLYGRRFHP